MSRGYTSALARTAPVAPAVALPQGPIAAGFESTAIPIAVSTDFVDLPVTAEVWRARWPSQSVSLSSSTSPAKWAETSVAIGTWVRLSGHQFVFGLRIVASR